MGAPRLRSIAAAERAAVLDLLAGWFDDRDAAGRARARAVFARSMTHDPTFRDDLCFVAEQDGRLLSTLQVFRKRVRAGPTAVLDVAAVGNVFTVPAARTGGLASRLLAYALEQLPAHAFDASLLFATRLEFYGRLGWVSHPRQLDFLPAGPRVAAGAVDRFDPGRDLDDVVAVYDAYSGAVPGAVVRDRAYWSGQLRYAGNPDERAVVARDGGRVVAYARAATLYDVLVVIEHGALPGAHARLVDCIAHLHGGAAPLPGTLLQLAPDAALAACLAARGLATTAVADPSWMWRIVDRARLAARLGVAPATLTPAVFAELFPAGGSRYWLADRF
jgi:GNAT superfamily N-acetyltransferase